MSTVATCECPPCPGRGNDGHGMTHCAECCFGSGVLADEDCPVHGRAQFIGDPSIADTCCGKCPGGTCYVDQVTGA